MFFLVVVYGCEILTLRKAEYQRIDAFEVWYWRRLLRVPLTVRRSNQSIQKEISPEYSLEGLMLSWSIITLATWWEELTHWKRPWLKKKKRKKEKTLMLEKIEAGGEVDNREWDGWMSSPTWWTWVWANFGRW